MRCDTCRFFDTSTQRGNVEPDTTGACRAVLPTPDDRDGKARWPVPDFFDWCAHYRPDASNDPLRRMTHPEDKDNIPF